MVTKADVGRVAGALRRQQEDGDPAFTLQSSHGHAVAFAQNQLGELREGEVFNTLNTNSNASGRNTPLVRQTMQVRRLTPVECERLQGFPDHYTKINDKTADGSRYKALGNSMAVPVMRWIGERIDVVDASMRNDQASPQKAIK